LTTDVRRRSSHRLQYVVLTKREGGVWRRQWNWQYELFCRRVSFWRAKWEVVKEPDTNDLIAAFIGATGFRPVTAADKVALGGTFDVEDDEGVYVRWRRRGPTVVAVRTIAW
jgi:hypothetical protein